MSNQLKVPFKDLGAVDLVVDCLYEGGTRGNIGDDPLVPLLGVGNLGGFRFLGPVSPFSVQLCVLYTDLSDLDWPDRLDPETGAFSYYGDNKTPGRDLHGTTRGGNLILRETFDRLQAGKRDEIPPFLVFTKGAKGRDVVFRRLAVPFAAGVSQVESLVAVWRTKREQRFQNYRARFTILDVPVIDRAWLKRLKDGAEPNVGAPRPWLQWKRMGRYRPLAAPRTKRHRSPNEQLPPKGSADMRLLVQIVEHYDAHPDGRYGFERCAAELFKLLQPNVHSVDHTRPWRDGGRDAVGLYAVGVDPSVVNVEFALEAKCKDPRTPSSSGVRETARLIARIRHRQFGVFVTTSCIAGQAYQELIDDGHPVVVIAGVDIVRILKQHGLAAPATLANWLKSVDGMS